MLNTPFLTMVGLKNKSETISYIEYAKSDQIKISWMFSAMIRLISVVIASLIIFIPGSKGSARGVRNDSISTSSA